MCGTLISLLNWFVVPTIRLINKLNTIFDMYKSHDFIFFKNISFNKDKNVFFDKDKRNYRDMCGRGKCLL